MTPSEQSEKSIHLATEQNILASERTFLSWIRTGLAIVGSGIVVIRFVAFEGALEHIFIAASGKLLIFWGIAIFFMSLSDFRRVYEIKNMPMPKITNIFVHMLVASLIAISLFLFIAV